MSHGNKKHGGSLCAQLKTLSLNLGLNVCLSLAVLLSVACNAPSSPASPAPLNSTAAKIPTPPRLPARPASPATKAIWQIQEAQLAQALNIHEALQANLQNLLAKPTPQQLSVVQNQWRALALQLEALSAFGELVNRRLRKQPTQTQWQLLASPFTYFTWPAELGVLDNNGTHGNTGLVFNVDIPINTSVLTHLMRQASPQEAMLGLYPLGLMLHGAYAPRKSTDLTRVSALSAAHKAQGITTEASLPQNRRRALMALQSQNLYGALKGMHSELASRDQRSSLNAFSQSTPQEQTAALTAAARALVNRQLQDLAYALHNDLPPWQMQWQYPRLRAQLVGLEQWLQLLEKHQATPLCQDVIQNLDTLITQTDAESKQAPKDLAHLQKQLAALSLAFAPQKQSVNKLPE